MADIKRKILIVDDEKPQRDLLGGFVESLGFSALLAATGEEALETIEKSMPDMVLLDVRLPGIDGIETLSAIRKISDELPVLLITAYADLRQAVVAVKGGADDYLSKPLDFDELQAAITDAIGLSVAPKSQDGINLPELPSGIVAKSPAMRHLIEQVAIVAPSDAPVLIAGQSGTGKEVVARLIHQWSARTEMPMIATNCAGLPESLIESELFGHVKGAFTGATEDRKGVFRAAEGGTLFLDEIGELPLHLQPKLLRALESKQVTPVGSDQPITVDIRLVAATNRNLTDDIKEGKFREDLYYRINVVELTIPPLGHRRDDILSLSRQFAIEFAGRNVRLSPQAVQCLLTHPWTGNVRELRNAIQRACLMCRGDVIMPEHLPANIVCGQSSDKEKDLDEGRLSQVERATILATLEECDYNRTHTAKKLGISRRALIYKIREMNIERDQIE